MSDQRMALKVHQSVFCLDSNVDLSTHSDLERKLHSFEIILSQHQTLKRHQLCS